MALADLLSHLAGLAAQREPVVTPTPQQGVPAFSIIESKLFWGLDEHGTPGAPGTPKKLSASQHRLAPRPAPASLAHEHDLDPAAAASLDGFDYWLRHDAAKLAAILDRSGSYRWCPAGGLDMWREDGRYVGIAPSHISALAEAGLLPDPIRDRDAVGPDAPAAQTASCSRKY